MSNIVEEKNEIEYSGSITKRLLGYMKPYIKEVIISIILVLLITVFELYKPILIGDAIDTYIDGYNTPYGVVEKSDLKFEGDYLTKDLDQASSFTQLILYQDEYYYFKGLDKKQSNQLYEMSQKQIIPTSINHDSMMIDDLEGYKLNQDDLKVLRKNDINGMIQIGILYVIVLVLNLICTASQTWILQKTGQNIIYTIREQIFHHVHSLPLRYFDTHPVGRIVTRVTNDVESLHEMYANILIRLFKNSIKILGLALVMLSMNVTLALYSFLLLPLIAGLTILFKNISRKIHREIRTKVSMLNTFLSENISGMRLIQIFANERMKYQEFKGKSGDLYKANIKQLAVFSFFRPLIYFISQIALAIVLYRGGFHVLESTITIGTLYIFINYISNFFDPIQDMAEQFSTLQNAYASAEKIFTILDEKNTILEKENPTILNEIKGKIEFKHVWFAYNEEEYVLRDVSFVIQPGEKVAFVGATGAGKTSILNLIGRYYDIQKGQILIDDVDIKDLSISQIRDAIGQMQQDVFIFTGDISSNIRLMNDEISDEVIKESAKTVNASHFIEKLPNTYHEEVSERGSTLSSGQRQLLSFARTLAFNPKILVMDEATANIDTETEQLIQQALERLMEGRTTIMVAHRLSTIQHADKIIVMHKGKIREMGTHQELLEQNGIYKKLYELQLYTV
ncbi:MAG: ABC transporter ATP-binding protein [Traorella sp.]